MARAEVLIHDLNYREFLAGKVVVAGRKPKTGLVPRDYEKCPVGYLDCAPAMAVDFPLIPRSEWSERIKDRVASASQLSDVRLGGDAGKSIPSLDQDGVGYCWAHSSTHAVTLVRALMGEPYVPLSAFSVAATIKRGADEGGWGAQSLEFITDRGVMAQSVWPQGDRNYKKYDKPENWANAALHKVVEQWTDLQAAQYDRTMSFDQEVTLLLSDVPVVKDENWWSHSILGLDPVDGASRRRRTRVASGKLATLAEFERIWDMNNDAGAGGYGVRIWNSWGDSWSDRGMGVLAGGKAVSDGAVAPRVSNPSAA